MEDNEIVINISPLKKTGVLITGAELAELYALIAGGAPQDEVSRRCHEIALGHGLPELAGGLYGLTESDEFCYFERAPEAVIERADKSDRI